MSKNKIDRLDGFAVITGASSGIGLELARRAGEDGAALLLVADRPLDEGVAAAQEAGASEVETLRTDLATEDGVDALIEAIGTRRVDALIANAGQGQGGTFLGTDWRSIKSILDTNITGTISLIHQIGRRMLEANHGPQFWAHVARALPDYRTYDTWLRENGPGLRFDAAPIP